MHLPKRRTHTHTHTHNASWILSSVSCDNKAFRHRKYSAQNTERYKERANLKHTAERETGRRENEEGTEQFPVAENVVSSCSRLKLSEWDLLSSGSVTRLKCCSDIFVSANDGLAFCCLTGPPPANNASSIHLACHRLRREAGTRSSGTRLNRYCRFGRRLMHISCAPSKKRSLQFTGNHVECLHQERSVGNDRPVFQRRAGNY